MNNFYRFKFSKKFKLLNLNHFSFVFQKPNVRNTQFFIILNRSNFLSYARIGIIISKKK